MSELASDTLSETLPKRRGTPADIAHAFVFLMSNAASWITGINLMVDGGGMYESKMPS